jgi:hypothetical protein
MTMTTRLIHHDAGGRGRAGAGDGPRGAADVTSHRQEPRGMPGIERKRVR